MFLDVDQFPFLEPLRRAWADIRDECLALADDSFEPWVQRQMYGEGWSVYGLIIPDGDCALRVGTQTRHWAEGQVMVFDDTVEHEAWNRTADTRAVLLFDFLRPGRTVDEFDEMPPEVAEALQRRVR